MAPALTYTLLALCAALFVLGTLAGRRGREDESPPGGRKPSRWAALARWSLVLQIGAIVAAYVVLRPGRGVDARAAIETASASGKPVFIDMYSNF